MITLRLNMLINGVAWETPARFSSQVSRFWRVLVTPPTDTRTPLSLHSAVLSRPWKRSIKAVRQRNQVMKHPSLLLVFILAVCTIAAFANKTEWPELVGQSGATAKQVIHDDEPSLAVYVIPMNSIVTMDYRTDRVRVHVDDEGIVASTPRVG